MSGRPKILGFCHINCLVFYGIGVGVHQTRLPPRVGRSAHSV